MGATILFNLVLASIDDDDFWERYKKAWKAGQDKKGWTKLKWLSVDITPFANYGNPDAPKYFSIVGHFRDVLKFLVNPGDSLKHKTSPVVQFGLDFATGSDWASRPFTTVAELFGYDDKGEFKRTTKTHKRGDPKGGKLAGRFVGNWWEKSTHTVQWGQAPSFMLYEVQKVFPIQVQNAIAYASGSQDAFDSISKGLGFMTQSGHAPPTKRAIDTAMRENDASDLRRAVKREMADDEEFLSKRIYRFTSPRNEKVEGRLDQIAEDGKFIDLLGVSQAKAIQELRAYYRRVDDKKGKTRSKGAEFSSKSRMARKRLITDHFKDRKKSK